MEAVLLQPIRPGVVLAEQIEANDLVAAGVRAQQQQQQAAGPGAEGLRNRREVRRTGRTKSRYRHPLRMECSGHGYAYVMPKTNAKSSV